MKSFVSGIIAGLIIGALLNIHLINYIKMKHPRIITKHKCAYYDKDTDEYYWLDTNESFDKKEKHEHKDF